MSLGDLNLVRSVVEANPKALDRRMSRFEKGATPSHFAVIRKRQDLLNLLIKLGADLEAKDLNGLTVFETAMLGGDREAADLLMAAGAKKPKGLFSEAVRSRMEKLADSVRRLSIFPPENRFRWKNEKSGGNLKNLPENKISSWKIKFPAEKQKIQAEK